MALHWFRVAEGERQMRPDSREPQAQEERR
jgi:hypothetical protein